MTQGRYVVWDFDGTLAHRPEKWSGAVLAAMREHGYGHVARAEDVRPFLKVGFPWHEPQVVRAAGQSADEWWATLEPVFTPAVQALAGVDAAIATQVARRVRGLYADPMSWLVYDDTVAALDAFAQAGWTQLLLSNHVPELRALVRALGLEPYFARIFNSAETGVEKPHPEAFRQVLATLPQDSRAWMVGDSVTMDVLGAEAVGMNAILVRGAHASAKRSCSGLSQLFALLNAL